MVELPRAERLEKTLAELRAQCPEVEAASIVTYDGLPMAAALPPGMDEDRVAAMCAALLSLGERASEGLGRGELLQVAIEGENGRVHLVSADDEAVLVAVSSKAAKSGLILFELKRAALVVAEILTPTRTATTTPPTQPTEAPPASAPLAAEPAATLPEAAPTADIEPADPTPARTGGGGLRMTAPHRDQTATEAARAVDDIMSRSPLRWAHPEANGLPDLDSLPAQATPAPGWS